MFFALICPTPSLLIVFAILAGKQQHHPIAYIRGEGGHLSCTTCFSPPPTLHSFSSVKHFKYLTAQQAQTHSCRIHLCCGIACNSAFGYLPPRRGKKKILLLNFLGGSQEKTGCLRSVEDARRCATPLKFRLKMRLHL